MAITFKNTDKVVLYTYHFTGYLVAAAFVFSTSFNDHLLFLAASLAVQSFIYIKIWERFKGKVPKYASWRKDIHLRFRSEIWWSLFTGLFFTVNTIISFGLYTKATGFSWQTIVILYFCYSIWAIFVNLGGEFLHLLYVVKHSKYTVDQDRNEVIKLKKEVLQDLISPHFLFNSLNTISSVISENKAKSIRFVKELSDLYGFMLNDSHKSVISLEEDLDLAKKYAFLLQTRLETGVKIDFEVENEFFKCLLPPMTIQNLVENCVKHNVVTKKSVLEIKIYVENRYLVVRNNLNLKMNSGRGSTSLGLNYICSQVEQLINDKVIIRQTASDFVVKIPLIYAENLLNDESINH